MAAFWIKEKEIVLHHGVRCSDVLYLQNEAENIGSGMRNSVTHFLITTSKKVCD